MENSKKAGINNIEAQHNSTASDSIDFESPLSIDSQLLVNKETDTDDIKSKKRDREEVVQELDSNKKLKLSGFLNMPNKTSSSSNINSNISTVAEVFFKIIKGNYMMQEHHDKTLEFDQSDQEAISENIQTAYQVEANIELAPLEMLIIQANSIEDFYENIARALLENSDSVISLVEYLISKNYDWKQTGKFNESIMHYLVTVPNIMIALDKFSIDIQRDLLQKYIDRNSNNPLLILAKLYAKNLNELYYINLKNCFKIIFDFDNDFVTYGYASIDSSNNSDDNSEGNNLSAFDVVYERIDYVLSQVETTTVVENYLEILAMMCVHAEDDEDLFLAQIKDTFKKYILKDTYLNKFDHYFKYYEQMDQTLLQAEDELAVQVKTLDTDNQLNRDINSFSSPTFFGKPDISIKKNEDTEVSLNINNAPHHSK